MVNKQVNQKKQEFLSSFHFSKIVSWLIKFIFMEWIIYNSSEGLELSELDP